MASFISYLKNVRAEMRHVVWPSQRQAIAHVILIVLISVFTALFIAALDYAFTNGLRTFI
jgi:preprotein translocase SecE subunit